MAEENVTTNIVVDSNFSGLVNDLNRATASLMNFKDKLNVTNKSLATQIAVMNRTFSETMRSTGQFSTHFVSLNSDVEKFGSQLDKGQIKLKQFFQVFNDHTKTSGGIIRQLAQQQVQLQNSILQPLGRNAEGIMQYNVHIPRGLDAVKNKTALVKQEMQILNRVVQEGANQMINWGKNTQWAGRQLTVGLTVPIAAFGKAAADAFKTADQELTRLTKVYGGVAQTSATELKKIRNEVAATAADLAKSYGASFTDTIALAADIAATGKQGNDLLNSVRETTRLSVLGEVDRQDAMKATLAIQTAFKQNTKELGQSINFLNAVENQTSTTLADLVEAIPKAGPVIKGLGGDVKDLALYLTAMREGGISATEGANALKSGLASLINPTKVAKEQFKSFGIDLEGIVTRNAGSTTNTILELQGALDKLDPLKKQKALEQLFGKFQFARMNALFSNLGKQGSQTLQVLDLMKASSQDLASIAGRELSQVTESASGKYKRALEGLKADLASVGDQFLTINTALINIVDKVIEFANHLPKPIKQLLSVLGMFTAAAGPLIMLTGVLGNFIGYVIKGVFHLRSLFKGGEGWKLLTPEILAANKAGSLAEQTFYSDAKAAAVFKQAVQGLTGSLAVLETQLNSGILNIAPQMGGMATAIREVNPHHPLVSAVDTRSMSHLNPNAAMTDAEKQAQTIFSTIPGAPKVNQRIGKNPQIYMAGDLPRVTGLTNVGGVSTGVVAGEAAKWHSMTAALAMQSQQELAKLKTEVATTGLVTEGVSEAYQAIFPKMNELVANAATESAKIVEAARVGQLSVNEAKAKIVALNAQLEQVMAQTTTSVATSLGRDVNLTNVPLTNQPIVSSLGKSNMKEITKPGRTRDLLNKIAGVLGVKTYGAPYSIETTRPKRFADGNIVPGTGNQDTVPALLTPGEFVVNKKATAENLPILTAINGGQGVPGIKHSRGAWIQKFRGSEKVMLMKELIDKYWQGRLTSAAKSPHYEAKGNSGVFGGAFITKSGDRITTSKVNKAMESDGIDSRMLLASINARGGGARTSTDIFLDGIANAGIISKAEKRRLSKLVFNKYAKEILSMGTVSDTNNPIWPVSNRVFMSELYRNEKAYKFWQEYSKSPGSFAHPSRRSSTGWLNKITLDGETVNFANLEAAGKNKFYHAKEKSNPFINFIHSLIPQDSISTSGNRSSLLASMVTGMNTGGMVPRYAKGNIVKPLASSIISKLTSQWSKFYHPSKYRKGEGWWNLANEDPLHGPLFIGRASHLNQNSSGMDYGLPRYIKHPENTYQSHEQFPIGNEREQALYSLNQYMSGYSSEWMGLPAVKKGLSQMSEAMSGKLYRGFMLNKNATKQGIPASITRAIYDAQISGNYSDLIGKKFLMRSGSWSTNENVANKFADIGKYHPEDLRGIKFEVDLKNRKVVPASKIFPDKGFDASGVWPGSNKENEVLFGGGFTITHAEPGRIVLSAAPGRLPKREHGGPVNSGKPYLVGEKGPEIFTPNQSGKIIPHYARGGKVAGFLASTLLSTAGYMGGSAIGNMLGGNVGSMIGGMLGGSIGFGGGLGRRQRDPNQDQATIDFNRINKSYDKSAIPVTRWKDSLAKAAFTGSKFNSTLARMALGVSRLNVVMAIGTTAAIAAYKAWDNAAKARKASTDAIQVDEKEAAQLGIRYKSVAKDIKSVTDAYKVQQKLLAAKAAGATSAGGGVNLTVKQLKDMQKELKQTSPDIIKMFDNMKNEDVVKGAADLKAQLVASGVSAEKATNKVYALMTLSKKAGMARQALGSSEFTGISDQKSAATYGVSSLSTALTTKTDKKELAATLDQSLNSINSYYDSINKVKDATGKVVINNKAVAQTLKEIKSSEGGRQKIGEANLQTILKEKPELQNVLSKSDTIADAWVKVKLYTNGVVGDLSKMSGPVAQGILQVSESLKAAATSLTATDTSKTNPFLALVVSGKKATAAAKAAATAAANASTNAQKNADAEMKKIDNKIKKINEEYDARRRLIELQASKESYQISLQKEQLSYQQALSNGDLAAAAQSQLNLKQMSLEYQKTQALDALQQKNNEANKKAEAEKAAMQDKLNKAQEKAAKLAQAAATAQQKASNIAIIQQSIANNLVGLSMAKDAKQVDELSKALESDVKSLSKLDAAAAKAISPSAKVKSAFSGGKPVAVDKPDWYSYAKELGVGKGSVMFDKASVDAMDRFGITTEAFNKFWGDLLKIPAVKTEAKKKLAQPHGKGYATGGLISGPGTSTSDSIYMPMLGAGRYASGAFVSTGEYVVNANAVNKTGALGFLNKLNYDPRFQVPSNIMGASQMQMSSPMNITFAPVIHAAPGMDERVLADVAAKKAFDLFMRHQNTVSRSVGGSKVVGR